MISLWSAIASVPEIHFLNCRLVRRMGALCVSKSSVKIGSYRDAFAFTYAKSCGFQDRYVLYSDVRFSRDIPWKTATIACEFSYRLMIVDRFSSDVAILNGSSQLLYYIEHKDGASLLNHGSLCRTPERKKWVVPFVNHWNHVHGPAHSSAATAPPDTTPLIVKKSTATASAPALPPPPYAP
jgi:hypothetical protein